MLGHFPEHFHEFQIILMDIQIYYGIVATEERWFVVLEFIMVELETVVEYILLIFSFFLELKEWLRGCSNVAKIFNF